jgi:protein ImuB
MFEAHDLEQASPMQGAASPRRFLALHLPRLPTDRLRRPANAPPCAAWTQERSRRLVTAVDAAAAAAGLHSGQALADAQAICPQLVLVEAVPEDDAKALTALAVWARRYSPLTAPDAPDGLLLDITGCAGLMGGEAALLDDALARLQRAGFAAQGAIAEVAAAAAALARTSPQVVPPGGVVAALAPLPIGAALRMDAAGLAKLGLRCVGDLLRLPRAPLARRFGAPLLDRLDALTGARPAPLRPVAPPPALLAAEELLEPVITRAGIDAVLDLLLPRICRRLREAGLGARRLALLAWRVDGAVQEAAIGTGLASREPAHLRRLFAEKLELLEPGLGFERMALEVRASAPMAAGMQGGLRRLQGPGPDAAALAELLDRLGQRLRVRRVAPVASHWPERMIAPLDPHAAPSGIPAGWGALMGGQQAGPVLLLRRHAPLQVVAELPDGPPALLRLRGVAHRTRQAEGPLRLEPEWWRPAADAAPRDYYRVELQSGARLWLYRTGLRQAAPEWRLHGHLA